LRPEALGRLQLPVVVKSGIVKVLHVQIPWKSLGRSSIVIHLDGLELLLGPNESVYLDPTSVLEAKRKRVQDAEELIMSRRDVSAGKSTEDTRTWLSTVVDGVIGNLKLSISNIHIRYEDSLSELHAPAAVGIKLDRLAAFSVDKNGKETYVSGRKLDCTRKAVELHGLSVYCQTTLNDNVTAPSDRWQVSASEYLVEPLNGSASYSRAGKHDPALSSSPQQDLAVTLDSISFTLSEDQYQLIMKLADKFSAAQRQQEFVHLRPSCSVKECPSAWWNFAINATLQRIKKGRSFTDWNELIRRSRIRNAYVPLYAKFLRRRAAQKPFEKDQDLLILEADVEPEVLLQWRLVAHDLVSQELKKQKGEARINAGSSQLDSEDWTQLQALLPDASGHESTVSEIVHTRWSVHVKKSRSIIKDSQGSSLLSLSCMGIQLASSMHLETTEFRIQVGPYRVESPEGTLLQSGQGPQSTLDFLLVLHPKGQNLDWLLHGSVQQAHVLFIKPSLDRMIDFFQSGDALSPALALDTADVFEQTVDEVKRQAQAQLTNFMRSVSRFEVVLDVRAPRITVPSASEGFQRTNLVLNLGHLLLNSSSQPSSASISSTTSDLYMKFLARLENVSACFQVFNGTASPRKQPADTEVQPLKEIHMLEECTFVSSMEQIWVPQPDFPTLRISARAPFVAVHFSPEIYHCLLKSAAALQGCDSQAASVVPWESAEYKGSIHVLTKKGIASTEVAWQRMVGAVAGPFLYILSSENSRSYQQRISLRNKLLICLAQDGSSGPETALAICPPGCTEEKAMRTSASLIFKADTMACDAWRSVLFSAIHRASVASLPQLRESLSQGPKRQSQVRSADSMAVLFVGEMDMLRMMLHGKRHVSNPRSLTEIPLLELDVSSAVIETSLFDNSDLILGATLASLEVKDLVSCDAGPSCQFLARSTEMSTNVSMPRDWSLNEGEAIEVFHDATESSFPTHLSQESTGRRSSLWSMADYYDAMDFPVDLGDKPLTAEEVPSFEGRPALLDRPWKRTSAFVQVQYIMRVPDSPNHTGVDAELILDLSGLSFYCNRPTVLALIGVSLDMTTTPSLAPDPAKSQHGGAEADSSSLSVKAEAAEDEERTLFRLTICVDELRATLNQDNGLPLAVLTKQKLMFQLQVETSSFCLDAELGQLRICDLSLGEGHQYGWMFSPRNTKGQSFAKITLASSNHRSLKEESPGYSLSVQTSEIRVVYLNRFTHEVTSYFLGLSPPEDPENDLHSPRSEEEPPAHVSATATPIKLAITFGELLLLLPESSSSKDYLEFDVGRLGISNSIEIMKLLGDGMMHSVSLDVMKVEVDGIRLHVMANGHLSDNMIERLVGLQVSIERPLDDPTGSWPGCHISVKVGHLQGGMCSAEYGTVLDCVSGNFSEMPRSTLATVPAPDSTAGTSVAPLKHVDLKTSVHFQSLALLLYDGSSRETKFAKLQVADLSLQHFLHSGGISQLFLSVLRVLIKDLTPGLATEERWVLGIVDNMEEVVSTAGSETALSAEWPTHLSSLPHEHSGPEHIHPSMPMLILESQFTSAVQCMSIRIQRPRLLLAPSFISHLSSFFTRSEDANAASAAAPEWSHAHHLRTPYTLQHAFSVLKISSQNPLVADAPGVTRFTFDGNEGSIELLSAGITEGNAAEAPLIIIGPGKHLHFKNVRIYGAVCLPLVVKLGAGSSYSVDEADGVRLLPMRLESRPSQQLSKATAPQHVPEQSSVQWKFDLQAIGMELIAMDQARWAAPSLSPETLLRLKASFYLSIQTVRDMSEVNIAVRSSGINIGSGLCVVEPVDCRIRLTSSTGYTDIHFSVSDLRTHFTFNTLELVLRMQEKFASSVYSVAERPPHLCLQFKKVWAYAGRFDMQRISFWRPIAPPGFVVLGDCLTTDHAPPTRGVLAVSLAGGYVKRPISFAKLWSSEEEPDVSSGQGCSVWEPVPPPGFVAVGCVAHPGAQPPPSSAVYCIDASYVCAVALRGCITVEMTDELQAFKFWRVENAMSTFSAHQEQEAACAFAFDLRYQLPVNDLNNLSSAPSDADAATTGAAVQQVDDSFTFEVPSVAFSSRQQEGFQQTHFFKLVWESHVGTSSSAVSVWRPLCPEGFAFVGDVISLGSSPPEYSVIIEEVDDGLLVKPSSWKLLSYISAQGTHSSVAFWSAIPPPGYSTLGVIVTGGKTAPAEDSFRCVRNDACVPVKIASASVFEVVSGNKKPLCKLWPVENQVGSFLVTTKSRKGPPRRLGLGFFVLDEQRPVSRVYVEVSLPVFSLTLYDDFGSLVSPLVKTSLDNLVVKSLYYRSSVVHQVSSGCSVDAFNTQQDAWEPCLEPWHGMVRAELAGGDVSETPLSTCRVVSNSKVNINLSSSNVNHFGEAYSDWLKLLEAKEDAERAMHLIEHDEDDEGLTDEHTHATERPGYIVQHNSSGIELYFRLVDRKSGARVFCLPSGSQACIVVPAGTSSLHPSSEQHSNAQRGCTLAFGIGELQIPKDILPNPEELVCSVSLTSAIDVNGFQCTQHARTSMKVPAGDGNMWLFFWNEVFLFESTYEEGEAVCVAVEQSAFSGSALLSFKWAPKLAVEQLGNVGSSSQSTTAHSWLSSKHGPASGDHGTAHLSVFHHCGKIGADGRLEFLDEVPDLPIQERWQPFQMSLAEDGPWTAISSVYGGGIVPKQVDGTVLAVQVSMVEGEKHLDIRSLVTVVNKTAATLEVCLCPRSLLSHSNDQPSNAASHAAVSEQASQNSAQAKGDGGVEVVEIFENERHLPFVSWSSSNLLPIDPKCWSDPISKTSSKKFKDPELPVGWVWSSDWHIEVSEHVDKDGWAYFPSFLEASWPPRGTVHRVKGFVDAVRRRRWVRFRQQSPGTKAPDRILCGLVEPGGTLPLPVPLPSSGQTEPCIQLRPCVTRYDDSAATATSFSWGSVDAHVTKTLKETTDSKQARLSFSDFCLTHLGRTEELLFCQQTSTESEQSETSWMLVQAIGTPLSKRSSFTLTMDWEILVEPPITLCNFLPEPITLSIWSSDPPSTDILLKEEELILEPGAKKGILSVHPGGRLLVALKIRDVWIAPDESEERVTIFHPQDPLPSEVSLVHKDTHRYLQVSIDRAWSATFGTLKEVSFSVPCWVDTAGCPPLVLSLSHTTSVTAMGSGSFQNFKRAWKEHKGEAKKQSKMQGQLSRDEVVHGGDEGSTVMLSRCGETSVIRFALGQGGGLVEVYGPDLSIAAVQSQSTMCNSQATAADGSYLPLVVFMDVSPYGSKGSKVLKIRPFMSLTNRLGEPVFVRPPEAEEHVTELAPSDWHRPLVCPRGYEDDTFQVRTSSSTWSYPLKLSQDAEVIAVVRLLSDNSRRFIRMDARSGGSASKRMISFRFGGLHLPYKLENHSSCSVSFRQSGLSSAAWEVLSPRSAADFAWEDPDGDLFLEAYAHLANETTGESSGSALDPPDTMMFDLSEAADLGSLPLPATGGHLHAQSFDCDGVCIVRFTNGCDSTVEEEESHLHQRDVEVAAPAGSLFGPQPSVNLSSKGSRVEISLDLMSVGLSIIDHRPQELLYAFSEGFLLDYRYDGQDDSSRVKLILKSLRIDNQLPLSPLPVLLFLEQKGVPEKDYVFKFLISSRGSMEQGEVCYPKLRLWLAQEAWQVNVHEAIVWRMWELTESICWDHFVAAGAGGVDGGAVAAVQVDPMIRIDRLVVSGAHLKLTLEAEPTSRPAQLLGAWNSLVTAAGNTKRMPVRLSGAIAEARRLRRSIFMEAVVRHVMRDLLHQSLRLLSGVDVLGVISSTLTALGHGALRLVHKEDMSNRHFQQALGNQLDNVGEGLLYGAEAMAKGVALGLTDVIVRSQSGYENHGPPGLLLGLSKGLAGLVLHPVTGFLHSLAFIVAGIDASAGSCARMVQRKPHLQRLRLPRAISVEGVVHEYNKESAVGQMALFMAEAGSYFGKRDIFRDHSKFALSDAYVKHIILPNSRLLLITNRRVMMLKCPVDPAGQIDSLTLVQVPSLVRWDVPWDNLLALEIKSIRSFPRPVVCVHMREPTPRRLYTIIRCPETHPAEQVLADIAFAFEAYGPKPVNIQAGNIPAEPSQHSFLSTATSQSSLSHTSSSARPIQPTQSRRFGRQHSVQTSERALAIGRHALSSSEDNPPIMARRFALPSMHSNSIPSHMETDTFIRAWVVEDGQSFCSTSCQGDSVEAGHFAIWKPVPPEGYISLGDVAWRGLTPPPAVRVYSTAPASVAAGSCSALAMPKDYFLVWRNRVSKTEDAVSIWRPIPPEGYVCIGCVAVGGYDKPAHGDPRLAVRCVRQDLVRPAEVEEELWHATTRWDQSWGCHVHQVNNSARTFVAVRSREEIGGVENGWDVR
ncbi:hypothetical protein CLOM_g16806, partial [Closterium sp. NIES-68]